MYNVSVSQPLSFHRLTTLGVVGRSTPSPTVWDSTTSSLTGYELFKTVGLREIQEEIQDVFGVDVVVNEDCWLFIGDLL